MDAGRKRSRLLAAKARARDLYGLAALVETAYGTGVVGAAHGPALRAAREARELEGQVAAAFALT